MPSPRAACSATGITRWRHGDDGAGSRAYASGPPGWVDHRQNGPGPDGRGGPPRPVTGGAGTAFPQLSCCAGGHVTGTKNSRFHRIGAPTLLVLGTPVLVAVLATRTTSHPNSGQK
ncbi:hypothetical protein GCM10010429_27820 [Micromonospora olivasterospora]